MSMIKRGSHAFIQLSSVGECDEKGKTVLSFGFKGKAIAPPDKPLMLIIQLIETLMPHCHYSSEEAMQVDLANLKACIEQIGPKPKGDAP